jgi:hypothetical protein
MPVKLNRWQIALYTIAGGLLGLIGSFVAIISFSLLKAVLAEFSLGWLAYVLAAVPALWDPIRRLVRYIRSRDR